MIESSNTNSVPEVVKKKFPGFYALQRIGHIMGDIFIYIQYVALHRTVIHPLHRIDSGDWKVAESICRAGLERIFSRRRFSRD